MNDPFNGKIAVVGLGALLPDAKNVQSFWQNILDKKVSIKPMPEDLFESRIYYDPNVLTSANKHDKSYTRIAAWIDDLSFDTVRRYKIPPSVAEHMDPNQHAALYVTDQALSSDPLKAVTNDRVAVILGNGMVGVNYGDALARIQFQLVEHYLKQHSLFNAKLSAAEQKEIVEFVRSHALKNSIPITEDSAPGILPNIIAGRIANVFDFHGPSFTVDAACASVLAAVVTGIQGLQQDQYDAVICGGADMPLKQLGFIYFSAINALSPDGSYPFDRRANGFVMGQGAGTVVLKRLRDAVQAGDRIYAVITGFGQASDGKGKYIAAPNEEWQAKTIEKACRMAGYSVDTIELIEAHGTATIVGDVVEVSALKKAFAALGSSRKNYCGLTSVKSNIGHLKSAAGIAGLIKAVLALHHKVLPPTASFQEINPKLMLEDSPFFIVDEAREWRAVPDHPRRANVSAFGFGGADYHLALEEFIEEDYSHKTTVGFTVADVKAALDVEPEKLQPAPQVVFFSAATADELDASVRAFVADGKSVSSFADQCFSANCRAVVDEPFRLAVVAESIDDAAGKYEFFIKNRETLAGDLLKNRGIFYKEGAPVRPEQVVIMFPGQASQYHGMFSALRRSETVGWFGRADAYWLKHHGRTVTSLIDDGDEPEALRHTENAHPAIFTASYAVYQVLKNSGLQASWMIGHSLGEITALAASEKMSFQNGLALVARRGFAFHDANLVDNGKMISVMADSSRTEELLRESGAPATVANINSPTQTIVSGSSEAVEAFKTFLDGKSVNNKILFVSHAFHSPLVVPVAERFFEQIQQTPFNPSPIQVMMNHSGELYPNDTEGIGQFPALLKEQMIRPVNFRHTVETLYERGVRVFVEAGPGSILTMQVKETLGEGSAAVIPVNIKTADETVSLLRAFGALFAEGVPMMPPAAERVVVEKTTTAEVAPGAAVGSTVMPMVVYSGVAVGLPGSYKNSFRDDNFEQIFEGRNFIERLTDDERRQMADLNIRKLVKDERGPSFKILSSLEEVIQLAGKIGKIDMIRDYALDESDVEVMTSCIAHAVAAGYEALKDAHIPLVREYTTTTSGSLLPQKWALPKEMQDDTGIIFANGFPMIDPAIEEASRYVAHKFGGKLRRDLIDFYQTIIERVKDFEAKKLLSDWFTLYYSRLADRMGEDGVYQFNHQFMSRISVQANNRLANLINARGPNFQLNAACSSTSVAVSVAEDFIRTGRAKRMLVIGADDSTSKTNLPWLGGGFLSSGAATNESDLYQAAVPFDRRRNGMIMSSGAVGVVLETREEAQKRGVTEICLLLGTHAFNTAKHPSQIDSDHFADELECFIARMEREHGLDRRQLASQTVYISHETYTPPRGGCSQTEAEALKRVFGEDHRRILIGNTKGMTGHTMGAALEDAVAAKSLQYGKVPPVVNYQQPDPLLEGLNLSKGGSHDRRFALKMSAGFGAQGHFVLLQKSCDGDNRITNQAVYDAWLKQISGQSQPVLNALGRLLVVQDDKRGGVMVADKSSAKLKTPEQVIDVKPAMSEATPAAVVELISTLTHYPPEILENDMELQADLGLSEEIQRDLKFHLEKRFGKPQVDLGIPRLTIGRIVEAFAAPQASFAYIPSSAPADDLKASITDETLKVFSEITKYPPDMLELNMEMEADLGIDTVKQATILSILGEKYRLRQEEGMQLSNYPTIGHIVDLIYTKGDHGSAYAPAPIVEIEPAEVVVDTPAKEESSLARQVVVLQKEPLGEKQDSIAGKRVWVIGDDDNVVKMAADFFNKQAVVSSVAFGAKATAGDIEIALQQLDAEPQVIIDCSHVGNDMVFSELDLAPAEQLLFMSAEARFIFFKKIKNSRPQQIICLTAVDGCMSYDAAALRVADPTYGALVGFYKGLRKEWASCDVRIIDFAPSAVRDNLPDCLQRVVDELEHQAIGVEIMYIDGERHIAKIDDRELSAATPFELTEKDVVLVTGGGSGIAAQSMIGLAERSHAAFIVVDLLELPKNVEELAVLDEAALQKFKDDIRVRLQSQHEKVTPVMVNQEFDRIAKAVEIHRTLEQLRQFTEVHYIASDVRDLETLRARLAEVVAQTGAVTAVVHAAGLEKSHLLEQKSQEEFHAVFGVKALGALNLAKLLPLESLRLAVVFSSIAGAFGNAAQLDYSAANSFLDFWVKSLYTSAPHLYAVSLAWSGWKDVGMAWRNEFVRSKSEEVGLHLIKVSDGVTAFVQEVCSRSGDLQVIRHKGLGPFIEEGLTVSGLHRFPLIDYVVKKEGRIERAFRTFSVKRDALIEQHRLGKVPILPAVAYSELAVEYFALQNGLKDHYLVRDITFSNAFKLFKEQPRELFVKGEALDGQSWAVEILSNFCPVKSAEVQTVLHSSSVVSAELPDWSDMNPATWPFTEAPTQLPPGESLMLMQNSGPEQRILLGPLYNDTVRDSQGKEPVLIYPQGVIYPTYFPLEQLSNPRYPLDRLLTNPCLVDSLYQACAAFLLVVKKRVFLPWEVKELGIVRPPRKQGLYRTFARVVDESDEWVVFNVVMVDADGEVRYFARNATFRRINL